MKRLCGFSLAVACVAIAPITMVGRATQETKTTPDISGFWELNFDSRKVPRANLLPTVTRAKIDTHAKGDAYAIRWCNLLGVPFVMDPGDRSTFGKARRRSSSCRRTRPRHAIFIPIERLTSARTSSILRPMAIPSLTGKVTRWWSIPWAFTGSTGSPPYPVVDTARRNRGSSSDIDC